MAISVSEIKKQFKCPVVTAEDNDYDQVRAVFLGGIDKHPTAIIRVANVKDVVTSVNFVKTNGLELAVRSGGHSAAGYSTSEGGIVIDLRGMKKLEIDKNNKTVWAETGLTAIEITNKLDEHGFVLGFGDMGSVGIGGITLGGGIGFLVRKFGMTIDNLLAAEIVTADGKVLQVDDTEHPELFWAVRGGGGNFGVVTRLKFKLHKLTDAFGGMLLLPAKPEVITGFMKLAEDAPDELSTIANVMPAPPLPFIPAENYGKLVVMALMMYAGDPKQGEKVISKFRALDTPLADMTKPMRYKDIFFPEDESYHPKALTHNMYINKVDNEVSKTILTQLNKSDAAMRAVQLRVLGGAMAQVSADATAYAHRNNPIMVNVATFYEDESTKSKRHDWVEDTAKQLYQGDNSIYVGFIGANEENRLLDIYPKPTLERLIKVKKQYDPNNLFKLNFNILPE